MQPRHSPRVLYLSLEALRPGHAAHTHVHVIADGMRAAGLPTQLLAAEVAAGGGSRTKLGRLLDYVRLTASALQALPAADIAYVRAHPAALVFALGARLLRKPVVHEINGRTADIGVSYALPAAATRLLTRLQHAQYRWAAGLVAVTPGLADWLHEIGIPADRTHTIPNGADGKLFHPRAEGGPEIAGPFALFFGGLVSWHGIGTMLAAVRDPAWPDGIRLVIAGDGPGRAAVEEAAHQDSPIIATGYLSKPALAGLAARALCLLCPIEQHGARDLGGVAPLKLFEGMASGRPIVATDLPFQAATVRDEACGIVVPPAAPTELAQAVAALAADRRTADVMGANGRKAIETRFDWRYRIIEIAALVEKLAANHHET